MKFYYLIAFISLFLIGCSSIYSVSDFSSKDKYYQDFNKSAGNKNLNIILTNDSTFNVPEGSNISNDELIFISRTHKERKIIAKNDIKDIRFYFSKKNSTASANIVLKNGRELKGDNVELLPDSTISFMENTYEHLSLNKIKEISYKNYWLGVPLSLITGTITGIGSGFLLGGIFYYTGVDNGNNAGYYEILGSTAIGLIIGGIWGWINGYTYTYQFNP